MKRKYIFLSLIVILLVIFSFVYVICNNENKFQKVNITSGKIEQTKKYKLYEFGISDNSICMEIDEMVKETLNEKSEYLDFEYVDVTKNMSLSNIYNINAIPTFVIVDLQGNVKYRKTGIITKNELLEFINSVLT